MIKTIVLITTGQPSLNPRIVKEANTLQSCGYKVTVLYCFIIDWATKADKALLKDVSWNYRLIGGSPDVDRHIFFFTKLRAKLARLLNQYFSNKFGIAERNQARSYDELLRAAKKIKADYYVGHNLGTLSVVVKTAKYHKAKAGFDFEDYHRGEYPNTTKEYERIVYLENRYVSKLDYISTSSPLIAEKITGHFPGKKSNIITLLNCFPLSEQPVFRKRKKEDDKLKLFWFSQTIGAGRGLELLIEALVNLDDPNIELTLLGRTEPGFEEYINNATLETQVKIHFAGTVNPGELINYAVNFDVGMALEPVTPENRNICLTNKIFTYILAGNAIILSDTSMQKTFNEIYQVGQVIGMNSSSGLQKMLHAYKEFSVLEKQRIDNYRNASRLNWEIESKKLLSIFVN